MTPDADLQLPARKEVARARRFLTDKKHWEAKPAVAFYGYLKLKNLKDHRSHVNCM